MNSLNPVYLINRAIYVITLLLYLAVTPGMFFQIILGVTQLVSAIYLTIHFYKKVTNFVKRLIVIYWILTTFTLIAIVINRDLFSTIGIIISFVVPMIISTLFMFIFYRVKKEING